MFLRKCFGLINVLNKITEFLLDLAEYRNLVGFNMVVHVTYFRVQVYKKTAKI
jgi:hypothetical protein